MSIPVNPDLLNDERAAAFIGLENKDTLAVWRCTKRYDLPYIKVGRKVLYHVEDLRAWLESRKVRPVEAVSQKRHRSAAR